MISISPAREHHPVRAVFSSLFAFIALSFISLSIVVAWLVPTLTTTDQYAKTVGPLATEPAFQNFIAEQSTGIFTDGDESPVREIAQQLLGQSAIEGKTEAELRELLKPVIRDSIQEVLASPAFATLWTTANTDIHRSFVSQVAGDSQTVTLDFHPLIVGAIEMLTNSKFGFLKDKIDIKSDVGLVTVPSDQLSSVRRVYDYSQDVMMGSIALAVIFTIATLAIAVHRLKTARRMIFSVGISTAVMFISLNLPAIVMGDAANQQQRLIVTLVEVLTRDFRLLLLIIASVCIGVSVVSKIVEIIIRRRR